MEPTMRGWRRYTLVEPPMMLLLFAYSVTGTVLTDLMLYRSCRTMLGARAGECDVLHTDSASTRAKDLEALIQPHASYILMCKSFVDGLIPAFLSLFMGPWSDKYGRKPLLVAGYLGSTLSYLLWAILCSMDMDPWIYLVASLPSTFAGGFCGVILASMCYITDIGTTSDRTWHFAWLQAAISFGLFLGSFVGRIIFENFGYAAVFATACGCSGLATMYVLFMVPETIVRNDVEMYINSTFLLQRSWCSLFDVSLVKDMLAICTKKRDGFNRVIVWGCIVSLSINILIMEGESGIGYMFTTLRLGWGVDEYTIYQAISISISIVGTLLGAKLFKTLIDRTMKDLLMAVLAYTSYFVGSMTKALTSAPWHLYLSCVLGMFGPLSSPIVRSALSAASPPQDIGKIFSLTTSMEAIIPLAASPLYTLIYTHNLPPIYPSPVYLVSAALFAVVIIIVIIVDMQIRKPRNSEYNPINEEIG